MLFCSVSTVGTVLISRTKKLKCEFLDKAQYHEHLQNSTNVRNKSRNYTSNKWDVLCVWKIDSWLWNSLLTHREDNFVLEALCHLFKRKNSNFVSTVHRKNGWKSQFMYQNHLLLYFPQLGLDLNYETTSQRILQPTIIINNPIASTATCQHAVKQKSNPACPAALGHDDNLQEKDGNMASDDKW